MRVAACNFGASVSIAVPNRMIENWYLADIAHLCRKKKYLRDNIQQRDFEGKHGKKELKRCFKPEFAYSETKHGPELFSLIRLPVARANSQSFDAFIRLLGSCRAVGSARKV